MAVKVHVKDFQSLEDISLEIEGLTVVTGQNNTGKSALLRAIRAALQNARGTSFIRHGSSKTSVELDFGDGHTLIWEKGRNKADKAKYIIDGGKPIHPGQGVPDEVRALGVKPIMAGGREVWPQIARQFDGQVFLLDQPGSVMAEAVADVERVSQLNDALRLASSDLRVTSAELSTRRTDLLVAEKELKRFEGLELVGSEVQEIEQKITLIQRMDTAIQALTVLRDRKSTAARLVAFFSDVDSIEVPEDQGAALHAMDRNLEQIKDLRARLRRTQAKVNHLDPVQDIIVPETSVDLGALTREIEDLRILAQRHHRAKKQVSRLEGADLNDRIDLAGLEKVQAALQIALGFRDHLTLARSRVKEAEAELGSVEQDLVRVKEELAEALGGFSQCPVCESPIQHGGVRHESREFVSDDPGHRGDAQSGSESN